MWRKGMYRDLFSIKIAQLIWREKRIQWRITYKVDIRGENIMFMDQKTCFVFTIFHTMIIRNFFLESLMNDLFGQRTLLQNDNTQKFFFESLSQIRFWTKNVFKKKCRKGIPWIKEFFWWKVNSSVIWSKQNTLNIHANKI